MIEPEPDETTCGQGMTVVFKTHFSQAGRRKELAVGEAPPLPRPAPGTQGRTPRITRLIALAVHLQGLVDQGKVRDYADIARLSGLTRARVTQIMNLNLLAPRIQEDILFLPRIHAGHDSITERDLRAIVLKPEWGVQVEEWQSLSI